MSTSSVAAQAAFLSTAESFAEQRQVSTDEVLDEITAIVRHLMARTDLSPVPELSLPEQQVLSGSAGLTEDQLAAASHDVRNGGWARALLSTALHDVTTSVSTGQAAELLGVGDSAVRHRLRKGLLWSFSIGQEHRLPMWQFHAAADATRIAPLPHLPELIEALPPEVTPAEINGLMTTPQPALEIADRLVTVPQWLLEGLPVEQAVQAVRDVREIW